MYYIFSSSLATLFYMFATAVTQTDPGTPSLTIDEVKSLIDQSDVFSSLRLDKAGPQAFPAYRSLLNNPQTTDEILEGILLALVRSQADRRDFRRLVVPHIPSKNYCVRRAAANLIGSIGTLEDAKLLIPLLNDPDDTVRYAAATSLIEVAGQPEVKPLEDWVAAQVKAGWFKGDDAKQWAYLLAEMKERIEKAPGGIWERIPTDRVFDVLQRKDGIFVHTRLTHYGAKAFPAYRELLAMKQLEPEAVSRIFEMLAKFRYDTTSFTNDAVRHLGNPSAVVRHAAVTFLWVAGTVKEAPALVPLLDDSDVNIRQTAVLGVAAIGGTDEYRKLGEWLKKLRGDRKAPPELLREAEECYKLMGERLAKEQKK
jgi:HEAT repeat protein